MFKSIRTILSNYKFTIMLMFILVAVLLSGFCFYAYKKSKDFFQKKSDKEPPVDVFEPPVDVFEPPMELPEPPMELPEPSVEVPEPSMELPEPPVEVPEPPVSTPEPSSVSETSTKTARVSKKRRVKSAVSEPSGSEIIEVSGGVSTL